MGISRQQALDCFQSEDLVGIGMEADAVRRRMHPEGMVSYTAEFRVDAVAAEDTIYAHIAEAIDLGATGVRLVGGAAHDGKCGLERLESVFRGVKDRYPALWVSSLS